MAVAAASIYFEILMKKRVGFHSSSLFSTQNAAIFSANSPKPKAAY
jgi:hypothetical protein